MRLYIAVSSHCIVSLCSKMYSYMLMCSYRFSLVLLYCSLQKTCSYLSVWLTGMLEGCQNILVANKDVSTVRSTQKKKTLFLWHKARPLFLHLRYHYNSFSLPFCLGCNSRCVHENMCVDVMHITLSVTVHLQRLSQELCQQIETVVPHTRAAQGR